MPIVSLEDDAMNPAWCAVAEEEQVVGEASRAQSNSDEPLLCREDPNSLNDEALLPWDYPILSQCRSEIFDRSLNGYGLPDLHNVDLGTPPDLQLAVSLSFWYWGVPVLFANCSDACYFFRIATGFPVWLSGKPRQLAGSHLGRY